MRGQINIHNKFLFVYSYKTCEKFFAIMVKFNYVKTYRTNNIIINFKYFYDFCVVRSSQIQESAAGYCNSCKLGDCVF